MLRCVQPSSCRRKLEGCRGRAVCEGGSQGQRQGKSHGVRLKGRGEGPPWLWPREAGAAGTGHGVCCASARVHEGTGPAFHIWFALVVFIKKADRHFFLLHSPQLHSKQLPPAQPPVTSLHTKGAPRRSWEALQESGTAGPVGPRGVGPAGCAFHSELGCRAMVWGVIPVGMG